MRTRTDLTQLEAATVIGVEVLSSLEERVTGLHQELRRTREDLEALREEIALARRGTLRSA